MKKVCSTIFLLFIAIALTAGQQSQLVLDYIEKYREIAVAEMIEFKIPASITMAQGILESGSGQSELAKKSNNHFGIKCHSDWKGDKVYYDDDAKDECFRKYDNVKDSYRDHSLFLSTKQRYAGLFELDVDDYKGWAKGLKAAGYATNPKYADLLINLIEKYELQKLDKLSLADVKKMQKKEDDKKEESVEVIADSGNKDIKKDNKKDKNFTWGGYEDDVFYFNRIPAVLISDNDTPEKLAEKHHKKLSLLKDYNDIENGEAITPGTKFYLQPKRKKGETNYHIVKSGETMWTISRDEGVQLPQLYKFNKMEFGEEPAVGEQINLRKKRKDDVKLRRPEKNPAPEKKEKIEKKSSVDEKQNNSNINNEQGDNKNEIYIDYEDEWEEPRNTNTAPGAQGESTSPEELKIPVDEEESKSPIKHTVAAKETLYGLSKMYGVSVTQIQEWNNLKDNTISIGQVLIVGFK